MRIPAFWSKAAAEGVDRRGNKAEFESWRSSDVSREDAQASALAAARRMLESLLAGKRPEHYPYWTVPMREEVLERYTDAQGELVAAVTRNGYGALVLNAARVMFIDVDIPWPTAGKSLAYFFKRLFNKQLRSPRTERELEAAARFELFVSDNPPWHVRLYRTAAGLRALVTHDLFDPAAESTRQTLEYLGSDPLYVRLCQGQECFRARLTPKPWRCGMNQNTIRWPRETEEHQRAFAEWLANYESHQSTYATCRLLGTLGSGRVHPEAEQIIALHDKATRCGESLELA